MRLVTPNEQFWVLSHPVQISYIHAMPSPKDETSIQFFDFVRRSQYAQSSDSTMLKLDFTFLTLLRSSPVEFSMCVPWINFFGFFTRNFWKVSLLLVIFWSCVMSLSFSWYASFVSCSFIKQYCLFTRLQQYMQSRHPMQLSINQDSLQLTQ